MGCAAQNKTNDKPILCFHMSHVSEGQAKASFPSPSSLPKPKSSPAVPFLSPLVKPARCSRINFLESPIDR